MARIQPIAAQRSIDIGGVPNTRIDDSIGQGLRQAGAAVQNFAAAENEMQMRRDRMALQAEEFKTDMAFRRFEDGNALDYAKAAQNIDPSGVGLTDAVSTEFTKKSAEFLQSVPDRLKPKFAELTATAREEWINKSAAAEIDQRNTWYRTGISEAQEKLQTNVFNQPESFTAALQDGERAIESSGLPPAEKETLRKAWRDTLAVTVGEREARDAEANPELAADAARRLGVGGARGNAVDQFVDQIIQVESGGNATAKNPKSSATGAGQFISSTWLGMVKKYRPDLMQGRSSQEVLALRNDPNLSREMTRNYAQENETFLAAQGIQGTAGNIYLAHFLGPRGAAQVLKANPATPIGEIVGADAVKANPFLRGKSASEVAAWAARKMGGASGAVASEPADERYASLPLNERLKLYDGIMASAARGQQAADARTKAAYDQAKGSLDLGIMTGEVTSEQTILDAGLKPDDAAVLVRRFREVQKDFVATQQAVNQFQNGALSVDPYSTEGRKTVDGVWKALSDSVPAEQLQPTVEELVRQTGSVPQGVVNLIRRGLTSMNVEEIVQAAQSAQRIASVDPAALARRDGGGEAQKAADDFSFYVNKLNLSPEEAARRMAEANRPEAQRDRKALEPAAKEFVKAVEKEDVGSIFSGWFSSPQVGFTPGQALGIQAEYIAIAEDAFYAANGDPEIARNRAQETMKRLYGPTEITGRSVVIKHPPERYWPAMPNASDPYGYIKDQIVEELSQFVRDEDVTVWFQNESDRARGLPEVKRRMLLDSLEIVSTPQTDAMIKAGELPAYGVMYKDGNGVYQTIPGKLFRPDISGISRAYDEEIERARQQEEQNRQEETTRFPQGRDGPERFGNGRLYYGIAREDSPLGRAIQSRRNQEQQPAQTPRQSIQGQRQQLFEDAQQNGTLTPQGGM